MSVPNWNPLHREPAEPSDADLIAAVRAGNVAVFAQLWTRHAQAARRYAFQCCSSPADADDLVSEAFTKVLQTLRSGGGPDAAFRTYLVRSIRNIAIDRGRRDRKLTLSDDMQDYDSGDEKEDTVIAELDRSLAARAFRALPERWQAVLWHTEVEEQKPREVAIILGTSAHNVAALAYRAREGLRQAYLTEYAGEATGTCAEMAPKLGSYARRALRSTDTMALEAHLEECGRCRKVHAEVRDLASSMRSILGPLILGGGAAAGYLAHGGGHSISAAMTAASHTLTTTPAKVAIATGAVAITATLVLVPKIGGSGPIGALPAPTPPPPATSSYKPIPAVSHPRPKHTPVRRPAPIERLAASGLKLPGGTPASGGTTTGQSTTGQAPPTTNTPKPQAPAAPPSVAVALGAQHHTYDHTTVAITVSNHTTVAGGYRLTINLPAQIELVDAGGCTNQGSATAPVLSCSSLAAGATRTITIALDSVANSDGTFSPHSGTMSAAVGLGSWADNAAAPTEIRCEAPYN